jgi:hypothetical protein
LKRCLKPCDTRRETTSLFLSSSTASSCYGTFCTSQQSQHFAHHIACIFSGKVGASVPEFSSTGPILAFLWPLFGGYDSDEPVSNIPFVASRGLLSLRSKMSRHYFGDVAGFFSDFHAGLSECFNLVFRRACLSHDYCTCVPHALPRWG